jgi:hypothetical protein
VIYLSQQFLKDGRLRECVPQVPSITFYFAQTTTCCSQTQCNSNYSYILFHECTSRYGLFITGSKICFNTFYDSAISARKYTEQHEWIDVQGKIGTVGVTDYAQGALGDVVFAQLPEPDSELNQMGISLFGNGISTISK